MGKMVSAAADGVAGSQTMQTVRKLVGRSGIPGLGQRSWVRWWRRWHQLVALKL